jgi:hypothetical protein
MPVSSYPRVVNKHNEPLLWLHMTEPLKHVTVSELLIPNDLLFHSIHCSLHHSKCVGATHILYDYVLVSRLLRHVKLALLDSLLLLLTKQSKLCLQKYS